MLALHTFANREHNNIHSHFGLLKMQTELDYTHLSAICIASHILCYALNENKTIITNNKSSNRNGNFRSADYNVDSNVAKVFDKISSAQIMTILRKT